MKSTVPRPSIFLRLFLSHLLMLLFSFGVGLFVFDMLFAPGLRPFLQRSPGILVPAVLALIGVAGLLAVWTSTAITHPLERLASAVDDNDWANDVEEIASSAPLEVAELAQALLAARTLHDAQSDVAVSPADPSATAPDAADSVSPYAPVPSVSPLAETDGTATSHSDDGSAHNAADASTVDGDDISVHDRADVSTDDGGEVSVHDGADASTDVRVDASTRDSADLSTHDSADVPAHDGAGERTASDAQAGAGSVDDADADSTSPVNNR